MPSGSQKPSTPRLDPSHPLASGLLFAVLFAEPVPDGTTFTNGQSFVYPVITVGAAVPRTVAAFLSGDDQQFVWTSHREGKGFSILNSSSYIGLGNNPLSTTAVTVCVVRRKRDTTARAGVLFGTGAATPGGELCAAHVPFTDGLVYWYFGASSQLTASGLSFSTTVPEHWIFTAGSAGRAIWQNGVKVASDPTVTTRTANPTDQFLINRFNGASTTVGDVQDVYYLAVYNTQWSDVLCRWWSAEPYALWATAGMQPSVSRTAQRALTSRIGATSALSGHGGLSVLGIG